MVIICGRIYKSIQRSEFCKDLNMDFTLFVFLFRHIMCTTTAIECRTLHVIFISIIDHWYYVGRTVLSYYEMTRNIRRPLILFLIFLCGTISIISDAVFDQTSDYRFSTGSVPSDVVFFVYFTNWLYMSFQSVW